MINSTNKMWGGRFSEAPTEFVARFTASVLFDKRMYRQDIKGSIAHAKMLHQIGVLTADECLQIVQGLIEIEHEISTGKFEWKQELEDVHMNIETALITKIGDVGKKLHTGRSRNDQVATDLRLWLRDEIDLILRQMLYFKGNLLNIAKRETSTIMPGFTHLQTAQPITFGHHLMAWFEMIKRDFERLNQCRARVNCMPLGSAALAGTTYPIQREITADLLGFKDICVNSLDAVSDRDFAIEFCADASICMVHLSRFAEELILWNSQQFQFVDLPDKFCTGSSIMPQKKNPDVPELVRGKTGRVFGALHNLLVLMKAQPLAYNKDNQEDKEPLFDAVDTLRDSLRVMSDLVAELKVNHKRMRQATLQGFAEATDLADYLVNKGLTFRDCHKIVGKIVKYALECNKTLTDLSLRELQQFSTLINEDIFDKLELKNIVNARNHLGGTAINQVVEQINKAKAQLKNSNNLLNKNNRLLKTYINLI